jgi:hypothetical protein
VGTDPGIVLEYCLKTQARAYNTGVAGRCYYCGQPSILR